MTILEEVISMAGFDSMLELLLVGMLVISGGYALYTVIRLHVTQYLFPNRFLYPSNCKPEDCTDVGGFIKYIVPRLLIFGIACLLLGSFLALSWFAGLFTLPKWLDYVMPFLGIGIFAWYIVIQNKVYKLFF